MDGTCCRGLLWFFICFHLTLFSHAQLIRRVSALHPATGGFYTDWYVLSAHHSRAASRPLELCHPQDRGRPPKSPITQGGLSTT